MIKLNINFLLFQSLNAARKTGYIKHDEKIHKTKILNQIDWTTYLFWCSQILNILPNYRHY